MICYEMVLIIRDASSRHQTGVVQTFRGSEHSHGRIRLLLLRPDKARESNLNTLHIIEPDAEVTEMDGSVRYLHLQL
jgi:hypothetical protein